MSATEPICSFCNQPESRVQKIFACESGAVICKECIVLCYSVLAKEGRVSPVGGLSNENASDQKSVRNSFGEFKSFRELLIHCLRLHDDKDSSQALRFIEKYLAEAKVNEGRSDYLFSDHNVQQALGFRTAFCAMPDDALRAEREHADFSLTQLKYWASAAADSQAQIAIAEFKDGNNEAGEEAMREALSLAALLGILSPTIAEAAELHREYLQQKASPRSTP